MKPNPEHCCDRCGVDLSIPSYFGDERMLPNMWVLTELRETYKTRFVRKLCKTCGDKADSYLNYWGTKKQQDIDSLNSYLRSGQLSKQRDIDLFNSLQYAGYF